MPEFLSYKHTSHLLFRDPHSNMTSFLLGYIRKDPISKEGHIHRFWGDKNFFLRFYLFIF